MQYLMEEEEYSKRLTEQYAKGITEGRNQIISVFRKFKAGKGHTIDLATNLEPNVKDFIMELKAFFEKD